VIVYWVLLAQDGRRADLNWIERHRAYGFTIRPDGSARFYRMTLMAYERREIKVYQDGSAVRAEILIDGHPSFLESIYISSTEGILLPKVNFVELHGLDAKTGERRYEKIIPN
jgi:hypothetical protein